MNVIHVPKIKTADLAHMEILPCVTRSFSAFRACGPVYKAKGCLPQVDQVC